MKTDDQKLKKMIKQQLKEVANKQQLTEAVDDAHSLVITLQQIQQLVGGLIQQLSSDGARVQLAPRQPANAPNVVQPAPSMGPRPVMPPTIPKPVSPLK